MPKYSEEFIAKVKRIYPKSYQMHSHAEVGSAMLGRFLYDSCSSSLPIDWLLKQKEIEDVHDLCKTEKEKVDLYREWYDKYGRS